MPRKFLTFALPSARRQMLYVICPALIARYPIYSAVQGMFLSDVFSLHQYKQNFNSDVNCDADVECVDRVLLARAGRVPGEKAGRGRGRRRG